MRWLERPPGDANDLCAIFRERPSWYRDASRSARRWSIPEPVLLAVILHESGFVARARPPRHWWLGILPGPRASSAYGYAQALDGTWREYERAVGRAASRRRFADAVDFAGWYLADLRTSLGLAGDDAASLYLAYHEGPGGFRRGTHRANPALQSTARRVAAQSEAYGRQLADCRGQLERILWLRRGLLAALTAAAIYTAFMWLRWRHRRRPGAD